MRGDTIYKILDFLADSGGATADFFTAYLAAGYGASAGEMEYQRRIRSRIRRDLQFERSRKRNLQKYISKLKNEGLIVKKSAGKMVLSPIGRKKLNSLKAGKIFDKASYKKEPGDKVTIVSYDIPVVFNKERDKMRSLLKLLGFRMIHKSVWVGKVNLPERFIVALEKLNIINYVEILEVSKNGTLRSL